MTMHPGPFNTFLAKACAVDEKTVTVFTRELKEAGLITSGGRGRSAPHMLPVDAARVLIALMATDRPSEAVEAVERWRAMHLRHDACVGDLPENIAGDLTLEQALVRLLAVDPDPKIWPEDWPAFQVSRNEKSAFLEWRMNDPIRAVFRDATRDDDRRDMAGIRRMCLVAPAVLMEIATGMWVDRFNGCDADGNPLDLRHPWNAEGSSEDRQKRVAAIRDYIRSRDADWLAGAY